MPVSPTISIYAVLVAKVLRQTIYVPLQLIVGSKVIDILDLLDSGAGGNFIHPKLALSSKLSCQILPKPIQAFNVDGTPNKEGTITHIVTTNILVNSQMMTLELIVARIGRSTLILGFPWLQTWNPDVDWKRRTLTWRIEAPSVTDNISGTMVPTATLINLISGMQSCVGLASSICQVPSSYHASPIRTTVSSIHSWVSLPEKAGSPSEPMNPQLQIDMSPIHINMSSIRVTPEPASSIRMTPKSKLETPTSMKDVSRLQTPQKTTIPVSIAMPDVHIYTLEEKQSQEDWIAPMLNEDDEPRYWLNMLETLEETDSFPSELEMWIRSKTHVATELAFADGKETTDTRTVEELVPKELHDYLDVFRDKKATQFPTRKPYDHKIETKPGFKPKHHKVYSLTPEEKTVLKAFIDENLTKGYIQPSKSEMASSFLFVKKKSGDK